MWVYGWVCMCMYTCMCTGLKVQHIKTYIFMYLYSCICNTCIMNIKMISITVIKTDNIFLVSLTRGKCASEMSS